MSKNKGTHDITSHQQTSVVSLQQWSGAERTGLRVQPGKTEFGKEDTSSAQVSICTFIWDFIMLFAVAPTPKKSE